MGVLDRFQRLPRRLRAHIRAAGGPAHLPAHLIRRTRTRLAGGDRATPPAPGPATDDAAGELPPLFFMHITKTAGGSLKALLEEELGPDRATFCNQRFLKDTVDRETLMRCEVLFGHFLYGVHTWFDLPPRYACFLRDPVDRVISHYYHLRDVDDRHNGDFVRQFADLDAFVADSRHWELDNFLCRVLTGNGKRQLGFGEVDEQVFQTAMDNLTQHFEFVGLFERMDESLDLLRQHLGLTRASLPQVNRGRYDRAELTPATLERLRTLNAYDLRLRAAFDRPVLRTGVAVDTAA